MKTYKIVANRKPADVVSNNDEVLETGYSLEEAQIASIAIQKTGEFVAVWIEAEETKPAPRVIRKVEQDRTGQKYTVVRCDNWAV